MKRFFKMFFLSFFIIALGSIEWVFAATVNMTLVYDSKSHKYSAEELILRIDGRELQNLPMPPVILNDYTMVPAREVFEQLGAFVDWDGINGVVYIAYEYDLVVLQINNNVAYLNEEPIVMELAPKIINDKTMIPVRFAAEALGFKVGWDDARRIVSVDTPEKGNQNGANIPQEMPTENIPSNPSNTPPVADNTNNNSDYIASHMGEDEATSPLDQPITDLVDIIPAKDVSKTKITSAKYPETSVTTINMIDNGRHAVDILASSEISKIETLLLPDNRLVVDFYGAEMKVSSTELVPKTTAAYRKIRVAQNQIVPEKITRVVLELQNAVSYSVVLSPDRKTLSIDFEMNVITDVTYTDDHSANYITITGQRTPTVNISNLTNPVRLVIDIPYTQISPKEIPVFNRFISTVRAAQFEANTARVVLDMEDRAKYSVTYSGNSAIIKIEEPTYKNIWYDNDSKTITLKKDNFSPINANSIIKTDLYSKGQYIFTLPGNYTGIYGYGDYEINDANMRNISIETIGGSTQITANERKVFAAVVTEDSHNIYIVFKNPKEVYKKIVVIDPGHGGSDPGTSGFGVEEKAYTLDISMRLMELLNDTYENTGIKAYATRIDDTYMSRFDRAPYANEIGDLFVSVHLNSAAPNQVPHGTETYYYPHDNDATIGITTQKTADIFQKHLLSMLGSEDRKVKKNNYTVLLETKIPSVLCEIGFLSNPDEAAKLKMPEYRQLSAQALYNSILETFSIYTPRR